MNYQGFLVSLLDRAECLDQNGFCNASEGCFVRFGQGQEIHVISIQEHSVDPKVCVNLGVHYTFLNKVGTSDVPRDNQIEFVECEVRARLTPASLDAADYWWPISTEGVDDVLAVIQSESESFFDIYRVEKLALLEPSDLEVQMPPNLRMLTKVRASLMLAKMQEVMGNTERAKGFVEFGINNAGLASGPKKALKELRRSLLSTT